MTGVTPSSTNGLTSPLGAGSTVAGPLGGVVGYGLVDLLGFVAPTQNTPEITPFSMIIAVAFSAGVGIFAGIFPAVRAARLHPIQALRYE